MVYILHEDEAEPLPVPTTNKHVGISLKQMLCILLLPGMVGVPHLGTLNGMNTSEARWTR
ncbi:MAG: hypothetical protein H0U76_19350 [Ktedonobacteraceae bacterium]|nr:hypothetical protein [Ktedonobacteraceae bacterium]